MATIFNGNIVNGISKKLNLQPGADSITNQLQGNIIPVFQINETGELRNIYKSSSTNNITLSVPPGKKWKLKFGVCTFNATATVGNRVLLFAIYDSGGSIAYWLQQATNPQTASVNNQYNLNPSSGDVATATSSKQNFPLPTDGFLPENFILKFSDIANIDAADSCTLRLIFEEYSMEA